METKHTPTPWIASTNCQTTNIGQYVFQKCHIRPENNATSCAVAYGSTEKKAKELAEKIVKAVNCHEELVDRLRHAIEKFEEMGMGESHDTLIYKKTLKKVEKLNIY